MKKYLSIFLSIVMLFAVIGTMQIANAEAEPISILTVKDQIRTVGRTEEVESVIACDWTASGIEFTAVCEENASIALTVYSNAECYFTVFIDDVRQNYRVRTLSGTYTPVFASSENGLTAGTHKIKIIKQTERTGATVNIKSFVLNNAALGDKPSEPQYIFESIGDSITSGYGSLDTNNPAAKYSDGTRTYAFITAQNFGAESRVTSVSGGSINSLYTQYIKNTRDDNAFDYSAYTKPNVVTIAFGTNDGPRTVDYWQTGIKNFADAIRTGYNDYNIPIVMVQNLMNNGDDVRSNIAQAIRNLESLDAEKYSSIFVTYGTSPTGGHPAQAQHKSVANKLTRDLVEFGIMPASALRSDATVTLTEKTTLEETLNKFDSVVAPGTNVTGITGELVSPLDPADAESETAKAVKYTADGTQSATTDYRYPQVRAGTVANKNDTEKYRTKGISFYINYKDTTDYTDIENPTLSKPKLLLSSGDKKATITLDVQDSTTQKVTIYWNTMPNISYVFSANIVYSNNVIVNLEMDGACEYTIDNMQVLLNKYIYTENADCAYTYTAGYSSYEVIGILDGYEGATTITTTTSTSTTTSTTTTTKATETTSTVPSTPGAEYTKVLDADNALTSTTFKFNNGGINGTYSNKGGVLDYTTIDDTYTGGNVYWMHSGSAQYNNFGFSIGSALYKKKVKSISFDVWANPAVSLYQNTRMGIGNGGVATIAIQSTAMGVSNLYVSKTTPKQTVTYDLSGITSYQNISDAYFIFCSSTQVFDVYFDNIVITYEKFAGTFTGGADGDRVVYADENGKLTTPTVTIADGEFAGWVTEDDADTIIPANTEINITKDTTYFAVSSTRGEQPAPESPVVESKTANSVTLVANDSYQYSKDGTTWQNSNVFSGLTPATTYTFYQRLKATSTKYASPASEGTSVETLTVYTFEAENVYTSDYTGTLKGDGSASDTSTGALGFVIHDGSSPAVGHYVTFKFTGIATGYYSISLFSRNVSGSRSTYNVTAYDEKGTEQSAGSINFGDLSTKVGSNQYYCNPSLTENVYVKSGSELTLKFTISKAGSSTGSYIDKFVLTKVAEVEKDGEATEALTVDGKASIRLGTVSGIRFYTTFDKSQITGTVIEKGTLIGPQDKIGDYLTIEDTITEAGASPKAVAVPYKSDKLWNNNEFVGSIVGIQPQNYNRAFVARAYVKLEDGTYLYSATTTTKTVAEIADAFIADATKEDADAADAALYNAHKDLVDAWASAND